MKTNVRESSIENHYINQAELVNQSKAEVIANAAKRQRGWCTRRQLAEWTGYETATVSGRVNALVADGTLFECDERDKRPCPLSDRTVSWVIHKDNMPGQGDLFGGSVQ